MANAKKTRAREARRRGKPVARSTRRIAVVERQLTVARKPWSLNALLELGRKDGGIDADQFTAGTDIVEAFRAITRELGFRPLDLERVGIGRRDMTPRELRLSVIYFAWGVELTRRLFVRPHVIVEWIEDERQILLDGVPTLRRALDLWDKIRGDLDARRSRRHAVTGLTQSPSAD
jgi:hypothetical protein